MALSAKRKGRALLLLTMVFAIGCSNVQLNNEVVADAQVDLLQDHLFPVPDTDFTPEKAPDFLQLPPHYQEELNRSVLPVADQAERFRRLRRWVYRKFEDYEFDITETYSLTQLNNSWINNQHINVTGYVDSSDTTDLRNRIGSTVQSYYNLDPGELYAPNSSDASGKHSFRYVVDINPAIVSVRISRQLIGEQLVLSLFYSNKSVEKLLQGDLGAAYRYTSSAIIAYPGSALAWNNLGVLYNRIDQSDLAIASFERAIALDEGALSAKSNLARLYSETGLPDRAAVLDAEVNAFRNQNPYYHAALAEESLTEGDLGTAKTRLENAIERKHNEFFFYHQLAIVNQQLGDMDSVIENLQSARRHARGEDRVRFSGKLRQLEELLSAN